MLRPSVKFSSDTNCCEKGLDSWRAANLLIFKTFPQNSKNAKKRKKLLNFISKLAQVNPKNNFCKLDRFILVHIFSFCAKRTTLLYKISEYFLTPFSTFTIVNGLINNLKNIIPRHIFIYKY